MNVARMCIGRMGVLSVGFAGMGSATNASVGAGNALTADLVISSARSVSTTQRRSKLALSARARAAAAFDIPGCRQAATASALKATLCTRRRRRPDPLSIVYSCPPTTDRGHDNPMDLTSQEGEFPIRLQ